MLFKKYKQKTYNLLRWSQKYTKTDMVYLARGGFWLSFGELISTAIGIGLAIAFANLLPQEVFGMYKYVMSALAILAIPTLAGVNTALTRSVARGYEGSFIPALKTRLRWGILGSIGSMGLAGYYILQGNTTLALSFFIASFFIPPRNAFTVYKALLAGKKRFDLRTQYSAVSQTISVGILIGVIFLTNNIFFIILSFYIPRTLLNFIFLKITTKKLKINTKKEADTASYGKHLSLMGLFGTIANQADKIILWHFLGPIQLALYSFALVPPHQIGRLFTRIFPIAFPKLSQRSTEEVKKTLFKKISKLYLILIPIIIIYIFFTPLVYKIFFPQYIGAVFYSQIFAITIIFIPQSLMGMALQAQMRKKELYIMNIVSPIITVTSLLILVPLYGILGAIIAPIIHQTIGFGLLYFLFKRM